MGLAMDDTLQGLASTVPPPATLPGSWQVGSKEHTETGNDNDDGQRQPPRRE